MDFEAQRVADAATPKMHRADFMLALNRDGFLSDIEAFIASPDASPECKILWHNTAMFYRNDPLLNQMAAAMGYTEAQIDNIFGIGGTHGE